MPRIYAANEAYENDWANLPAENGVLALPAGADTSWFSANSFTIDNSKHVLTVLDQLTPVQLRALCDYIGLAIDQGANPDTKAALIRAIEGEISSKYITTLTVASVAGTASGDSNIAVTDPGTLTYKWKSAKTTAPTILFKDVPDSTWRALGTPAGMDITPIAADHDKITVISLDADGYVVGIKSLNLVKKA
jgi:hypothetical protein